MKRVLWQKTPVKHRYLYPAAAFALSFAVLLTGCGASAAPEAQAPGAYALSSPAPAAPEAVMPAPAAKTGSASQSAAADKARSAPSLENRINGAQKAENANPSNREAVKPTQQDNSNYEDTYFESAGVNPFIYTDEEPASTFAVDVDTASYSKARNYINNGTLPPSDAVRPEEFINYFRREYQPPQNDNFSIYTEAAPSYFGRGYHMIEVGLQAKTVAEEERKDASLTFVIDVSGSMNRDNRLELVKQSLRLLVDRMRNTDKISIAVYGTKGRELLSHTAGNNKAKILKAISGLSPEGSTNAGEGLRIGYGMASDAFIKNGINRVILCTDGVANQGTTDPDAILRTIDDYRAQGVTLTCLGFGMENYNDVLLETLADKGDGNYAYIDTLEEASKVLLKDMTGTLQVIAKDVKAQVEFNSNIVEEYRLIGYENRSLATEDFRNDYVDGGEVGAGHAVTALYEVRLRDGYAGDLGVVRVRYEDPQTGKVSEVYRSIGAHEVGDRFEDATPRFRFLTAVAETAEILRGSRWASRSTLDGVLRMLEGLKRDFTPNAADTEFIEIVKKAAQINN